MNTQQRCEIGYKLALFPNRMLHTNFQSVAKSVTLSDLTGQLPIIYIISHSDNVAAFESQLLQIH